MTFFWNAYNTFMYLLRGAWQERGELVGAFGCLVVAAFALSCAATLLAAALRILL